MSVTGKPPLRHRDGPTLLRHALYAMGFGTAFGLTELFELVTPSSDAMYHSTMGAPTVLLADLALLFFIATAYFATRTVLRLHNSRRVSQTVLLLAVPPLLVLANRGLLGQVFWLLRGQLHLSRSNDMFAISRPGVLAFALVWVAVVLLARRFSPAAFRAGVAAGKLLLLFSGVLAGFILLHAFQAYRRREHQGETAAWHTRPAPGETPRPRVVWIILDELSYKYAFPARPPGIALPALDALAAQSNTYTHVQPLGMYTDVVIPSLLLGREITDVSLNLKNQVELQWDEDDKYHPWQPAETVFGQAEAAGWNAGIDGWWNPYCSLYADTLQHCYWTSNRGTNLMRDDRSAPRNFGRAFNTMLRAQRAPVVNAARLDELDQLMAQARRSIADDRLDLLLIHLPAPHHPYVFDPKTHAWTAAAGKSYAEGLAGADDLLRQLMRQLQQTPRWQNTMVIVHGDHGWRTQLWRHEPGWTPEDQRLSARGFDDRPLLAIHLPGQEAPAVNDAPVSLMLVHDAIAAEVSTGHAPDLDQLVEALQDK